MGQGAGQAECGNTSQIVRYRLALLVVAASSPLATATSRLLHVSLGSINGRAANAEGGIQASDEREYWTGDDAELEEREGRGGKEEDGAPSPAAIVEEVY
jgi:hypothetical protein